MIRATVIRDSISPAGIRLTTMELVYPRFIHPEFMTHRKFSRNASSSRAIPTARLIEIVRENPVMPLHWGRNQKGMQAREELDPRQRAEAQAVWGLALMDAVSHARKLAELGAHKQIVNRLLEPFLPIRVVCTATDWANFFALRRHHDAQPEIQVLANAMWEAREASTPKLLQLGEWHLPYVTQEDWDAIGELARRRGDDLEISLALLRKVSAARCARVSYKTHDGSTPSLEADLALCEKLTKSSPIHASPFEHQATPDWIIGHDSRGEPVWAFPSQHGNLRGWRQYRKMIPGECVHG